MKRFALLTLVIVSLAALSVPVSAQETPTVPVTPVTPAGVMPESTQMPETTETPSAVGSAQSIVHLRIAYLSSEGDVLVPYLDGESSDIQTLYPATLSGWVDVPVGTSLSLVPEGGDEPVVGPLTLRGTGSPWTTMAVTGSAADDTLSALTFNEQITALPFGCAQVTILNTVQDGPGVDLMLDDGNMLDTNIGLAGSSAAADAAQYNTCAEAGMAAAAQQGGVFTCNTVGSTTRRYANCGVTVLVPAEMATLQGIADDDMGDSRFTLDDIQPNTFYFVTIGGTADNPQTLVQSVPGTQLTNMAGFMPQPSMQETETATPVMDQATAEPTTSG